MRKIIMRKTDYTIATAKHNEVVICYVFVEVVLCQ